jgi:hypothetical protein
MMLSATAPTAARAPGSDPNPTVSGSGVGGRSRASAPISRAVPTTVGVFLALDDLHDG